MFARTVHRTTTRHCSLPVAEPAAATSASSSATTSTNCPKPHKAYWIPLAYPWKELIPNFSNFLRAYWQWFADNDAAATSPLEGIGNGGLFTLLKLNHVDTSDHVVLAIQYTGPNGQVGGANDIPLNDFINKMNAAAGLTPTLHDGFIEPNIAPLRHPMRAGNSKEQPLNTRRWTGCTSLK